MGKEHPGGSALNAGFGAAGRDDVTGVAATGRYSVRYPVVPPPAFCHRRPSVAPSIHRPSDIQAPQQSLSGSLTRDTCESIGQHLKIVEKSV